KIFFLVEHAWTNGRAARRATRYGRHAGKVPERGEWIGRHLSDRSLRTASPREGWQVTSCRSGRRQLQLFLHRPERQHNFAKQFIEHLREAGVDRGETAEDSLVAGSVLKALARTGKIANSEHEEQNRQSSEHDLQGPVEPQRAQKHHA